MAALGTAELSEMPGTDSFADAELYTRTLLASIGAPEGAVQDGLVNAIL